MRFCICLRRVSLFLVMLLVVILPSYGGAPIPFTINMSENVVVTGVPRLQLDVGGVTRYAPYVSGSGTNSLSFAYTVVAPDFDRNGIALVSPLDLNGGTIKDVGGNDANLNFTLPNTSGVMLQSYTTAWTTAPITPANSASAAFAITGAPTGATYNYTITSDGGGTPVTGTGTIGGTPHNVTGVNLNTLLSGTLTLSVTVTNATGTGNAKTNTVVATISSFTGVLDSLPASAAAYSVRRLRTAYTGALIRVRRSNDNTEQDIGYQSNGDLDTTALATFCGASSCFVKTWYDQSGNARNAAQASNSNQPRIVNAGIVDTFNSRPAINWMISQSNYLLTSYVFSMTTATTVSAVFKPNSLGSSQLFDIRLSSDGNPVFDCGNTDGFAVRRRDDLGNLVGTTNHASRNTSAHTTTKTYDGSVISSYLDGGDLRTASSTSTTLGSTYRIALGTNGFSPGASLYDGYMGDFIYFNSLLSTTNRQALEANQKAYYSTP